METYGRKDAYAWSGYDIFMGCEDPMEEEAENMVSSFAPSPLQDKVMSLRI